ncbi:MAG TPA: hypothetical protein VN457_05495, partial [Chlamydiales bacterium]|nr:hypothetical protein [Chlamydiales bacterium]
RKVQEALDVKQFANAQLFHTFRQWMRTNTRATPLVINGKKINVPIRIGTHVFGWINNHPDLVAKGIQIQK